MKKQVHIKGTLLTVIEPGRPAFIRLEDQSLMRTSTVVRRIENDEEFWFETKNTLYCLDSEKNTSRRGLKEKLVNPCIGLFSEMSPAQCAVK